jgi:hypothetical protein
MSFSYDVTQLDQPLHRLRLLIGDNVQSSMKYHDEELEHFIQLHSNIYLAAVEALEILAARSAEKKNSLSADGISVSYAETQANYLALADRYRTMAARHGQVSVYVGGRSKAERSSEHEDSDYIPMHFHSHIHDNVEASRGAENLKGGQ